MVHWYFVPSHDFNKDLHLSISVHVFISLFTVTYKINTHLQSQVDLHSKYSSSLEFFYGITLLGYATRTTSIHHTVTQPGIYQTLVAFLRIVVWHMRVSTWLVCSQWEQSVDKDVLSKWKKSNRTKYRNSIWKKII